MRQAIPSKVKRLVIDRATALCEYCKHPEEESFYAFHIDHIISLKHKGSDLEINLCYSCPRCNRYKGSDISTIISEDETLVRLFHPRRDNWIDHFTWNGVQIMPLSDVGAATIQLLQMNHVDRLIERQRILQLKL